MSPQARDATIKHFSTTSLVSSLQITLTVSSFLVNNVHVTVFLVSLKAGGVALNLTEVGIADLIFSGATINCSFRHLAYISWIVGAFSSYISSCHRLQLFSTRWNPAVEYRELFSVESLDKIFSQYTFRGDGSHPPFGSTQAGPGY